MTNTNAVPGAGKPANLAVSAKEKLGRQVTNILENLPPGLEVTIKLGRGNADVSLGFVEEGVELPYADLLAGDTLYEGLTETITMLMNSVAKAPSMIVDTNHAIRSPAAAIQLIEQLLQGNTKTTGIAALGQS